MAVVFIVVIVIAVVVRLNWQVIRKHIVTTYQILDCVTCLAMEFTVDNIN